MCVRGCVTMIGLVWERGNFRTLSLDSQHCPRKRECWRDHALEGASSYGQAQGGLWPWPAQQTLRPGQCALSCPSVGGATAAQAREAAPTVHGPQTVWLQGTAESRAAPASHCLRGAHALLPQGAEGFHSPPQHPNANPAQLSVRRAWLSPQEGAGCTPHPCGGCYGLPGSNRFPTSVAAAVLPVTDVSTGFPPARGLRPPLRTV